MPTLPLAQLITLKQVQNSKTEYFVRGIPFPLVERMWPFAEPYIKRALDHTAGEVSAADLLHACMERDVQLWLISTRDRVVGAATTEIINYPRRRHCRIITLAGSNFSDWVHLADEDIRQWALAQGCNALETYCRKGFVPKLVDIGYKYYQAITIKQLEPLRGIAAQSLNGLSPESPGSLSAT